jgi:hypothetical protein
MVNSEILDNIREGSVIRLGGFYPNKLTVDGLEIKSDISALVIKEGNIHVLDSEGKEIVEIKNTEAKIDLKNALE